MVAVQPWQADPGGISALGCSAHLQRQNPVDSTTSDDGTLGDGP